MPTTELVLSHKHPDDKAHVAAVIDDVIRHGRPFSSRHRIIDTQGRIHVVVVVSDRLFNDREKVIGTAGFYIDITDAYEGDVQARVDQAVGEATERRAVVEQAKGILMFVDDLPAEHAFGVLKRRAQECNISVYDLSSLFVREVTKHEITPDSIRRNVNRVLLTAHERMTEKES